LKKISEGKDKSEEILILMDLLFKSFREVYGGLKTWEDWVDLYMVVWRGRFQDEKDFFKSLEDEPEMHPHCFNDLVHKTTLLFQSVQDVRLPFAEAQKRVTSTVCSLTGWKPTNEVKYHLFNVPTDSMDWVVDESDIYFKDKNLEEVDAENLNEDNKRRNYKIKNTGQTAAVTVASFRYKEGPSLTNAMISFACVQSKRWAKSNNKNQNRDWHQIVSEMCKDSVLRRMLIPIMIDGREVNNNKRQKQPAFFDWTTSVREYVLGFLFSNENDVDIFQTEKNQAINDAKQRLGLVDDIVTPQDFVDFCLKPQLSSTPRKRKIKGGSEGSEFKSEIHRDGGLYWQRPPSPKMSILIATMFSYLASGSKKSIDAIEMLATLNGGRVTDPRYKPDLGLQPFEEGYKTMVRHIFVVISVYNEITTFPSFVVISVYNGITTYLLQSFCSKHKVNSHPALLL
jgi:hypothetical protein